MLTTPFYVNHPMEKSKVQLPHQRAAALYSLSNQNAGSSLIFLFLSIVMALSPLMAYAGDEKSYSL